MRKLLGLDSDDDNDDDEGMLGKAKSSDGSSSEEEEGMVTEMSFIPGKGSLKDKIRSKLESKRNGTEEPEELTPWQKYLIKRKEKRRERRKAVKNRRKGIAEENTGDEDSDDGMYGSDPEFGVPESDSDDDDKEQEKGGASGGEGDDFFAEEVDAVNTAKGDKKKNRSTTYGKAQDEDEVKNKRVPSTKEELELLIAGDNDEEAAKDFDIRGLVRMEKNAGKKLRGSRKRKEAARAANVSGTQFKMDTKDERFAALLEGSDDRFGIDRTDPNYKETPAMKEVLAEQTKNRKRKRAKTTHSSKARNKSKANDSEGRESIDQDVALSSLVKSIKTKVANTKK